MCVQSVSLSKQLWTATTSLVSSFRVCLTHVSDRSCCSHMNTWLPDKLIVIVT